MYELIQAGEKTYYINCPAKMGLYRLNDSEVCLIDSGNDKDAGKKVLKILEAGGWKLKMVINPIPMPTTSAETAFWRRGQAVPSIRPVLIWHLHSIRFWNRLFYMAVIRLRSFATNF